MFALTFSRETISKILLELIRVGVLFILFLPLVMNSRFFFPFIVPKNVFFRIAVEIIFIAYLILVHLSPKYKPKFSKITVLVITFFIISFIAGLVGIGFDRSFWGNYERMGGIFHLLHLTLFFFVLVNVFKEKKNWHSFFTFSIFASTLMSFLALAQWLQVPFLLKSSGGSRLAGTVGNASFLAAYFIFNLFFILYFWAREKRFDLKLFTISFIVFDGFLVLAAIFFNFFSDNSWGALDFFKTPILNESLKYPKFFWSFLIFQLIILIVWFFRNKKNVIRVLLSVIFLFEFFIFFQTQTRGALIGFATSIAFLLSVSLFLKIDKKIKIVSLIILLSILISPFVLVANKESTFIRKNSTLRRLAEISLTDLTTESRLLTWQASWRGWTDTTKSFLIGYGPENYYYAFNKYFPVQIYKDSGSRIWFDRAHNIIFDIAVTTGILGLIVYLGILAFALFLLFKEYRRKKVFSSSFLLAALLIAYFIQNFFVFDTLNTEIPFYLFLAFVVFLGSFQKDKSNSIDAEAEESEVPDNKDINIIYISILVVILLFGIFAINFKTLKSNNYIFHALVTKNSDTTGKGPFEYFKKAIDESVVSKFEARQQLANYVNGFVKREGVPADQIKTMMDYVSKELKNSIAEEPLNIRQYLFLATFKNATTKFNRANSQEVIDLLTENIDISPTRPHVYYEIAQAYAFLNNYEKAKEYFERGAELAPNVIDDQWNLLTIYIVFEKYDLADQQLKYMLEELDWEPTLIDYDRLSGLYGRIKNYSKMIEFQEKIVEIEPSAKNYAKLAALYAKIGENQKAREETQKAIAADSGFAAEAKIFLEQLEKGELLDK